MVIHNIICRIYIKSILFLMAMVPWEHDECESWNPKSRGEFLMIGYLYKVYRNIIQSTNLCLRLTLILTQCVCRVYLSISILNTTRYYYRSTILLSIIIVLNIYMYQMYILIYICMSSHIADYLKYI